MTGSKVVVIAKKEFFDSIKSRTFLVIFSLFLLLTIASSVTGANNYNDQLDQYQKRLVEGQYAEEPETFMYFPEPVLTEVVFQNMVVNIGLIGAILAIILGYNAVSGEKERGNLKLLLSYPLYREDVINGKFLGKIGVLVLTLVITTILSIAVALIMGMDFTGSELTAVVMFMGISAVYLTTFLGISIFFSTVSKNGPSSMLNSFMFWVMTTIIVSSFSGMVADAVVPVDDTEFYGEVISTASGTVVLETYSFEPAGEDQGESFFDKYQRRWKIQNTIESSLSPTQNLEQLAGAVLGKDDLSMLSSDSPQSEMGMYEIVLGKLSNIVAMFVWVIVSLAATYIVFMRQDIR